MIWIAYAHHDDGKRFVAAASANRSINGTERSGRRRAAIRVLQQALEACSKFSAGTVGLSESIRHNESKPHLNKSSTIVRSNYASRGPGIQARAVTKCRRRGPPPLLTQRAGIASPHAEGDGLSGVTGDAGLNGATGTPAAFPDGLPLARAMNPWAMPEAST